MTDYTKPTGSTGTMMIRDTGTTVEFWIKAGSATFCYDMPWGYTVNGTTDNVNSFRFESGGSYQRVGAWTVSTEQTVTFRLYDTGTSGLGGPTTFSQLIPRADIPDAPGACSASSITSTSMVISFADGANNGAAIDSRQISYGTTSAASTTVVASDGSTLISGLTPGTTYYFKARTHNSKGYGPYNAARSAKTLKVPDAPGQVTISAITQVSVKAVFADNANGGATITDHRVGYSTVSTGPTNYATGNNVTISGLTPGTTYYFWGQAYNSIGWSPVSAISTLAKTIAGAKVLVGAVWHDAIPYVRTGGVWKVARPWSRISGVWKESS